MTVVSDEIDHFHLNFDESAPNRPPLWVMEGIESFLTTRRKRSTFRCLAT